MSICPVCGCRTEELDFVDAAINGTACRTCSFCEKQLKNFGADAQPTEAQLRWLDAVINKEVPERSAELVSALGELKSHFTAAPVQSVPQTAPQKPVYNGGFAPAQSRAAQPQGNEDERITVLEKRINFLENELKRMKRTAMIKSILEITIPIILGIIILIIFFSSGFFDWFTSLYGEFMA